MSHNDTNYLKAAPPNTYEIAVISDGTHTLVEISGTLENGQKILVANGKAKRRKGERRDETVGQLIAFQRAFEDAAEAVKAQLTAMGRKGWATKAIHIGNIDKIAVNELTEKAKAAEAENGGEG